MVISLSPVEGTSAQRVHALLAQMQAWPHWSEIALGAQKEYGMSEQEFSTVLPEFQRFMALSAEYRGLGMLGERPDVIWHSLILNTGRYREYCQTFMGRFVDHLPCSSYGFYGVGDAQADMCKEPPATCMDPWPAPPDPSPVPPKRGNMHQSILEGAPRFVAAYTEVFGHAPDVAIWPRAALVDGIAL
jgi:hypothetical protein